MANEEKLEMGIDGYSAYEDPDTMVKLTFSESIRHRPGMYIGTLDQTGLFQLFKEAMADSMDEVMLGHCKQIKVTLGKDYSITVEDNGRAIPVAVNAQTGSPLVELKMTTFSTPWKQSERGYTPFAGSHSIGGICTVNALSDWMETTVKAEGKIYRLRFEHGIVAEPLHVTSECSKDATGTTQKWLADKAIFQGNALDDTGNLNYNPEHFLARIRELCFLNPNTTITWHDELNSEKPIAFHYENGLRDYMSFLNNKKQILQDSLFYYEGKDDVLNSFDSTRKIFISAKVAFQYNISDEEVTAQVLPEAIVLEYTSKPS
jgi:DNA gyrase subunit B